MTACDKVFWSNDLAKSSNAWLACHCQLAFKIVHKVSAVRTPSCRTYLSSLGDADVQQAQHTA